MNQRSWKAGERRKFAKSMRENGRTIAIGVVGFSFARAVMPILVLAAMIGGGTLFALNPSHHGYGGTFAGAVALGGITAAADRNDLLQAKGKLVADMRAVLNKATAEKRDLTADEQSTYDKMEKDLDAIIANIKRLDTIEAHERDLSQASTNPARPGIGGAAGKKDKFAFLKDPQYVAAFDEYVRGGIQAATLNVGTNADGGYLVPTEYSTTLIELLNKQSAMRQLANKITTASDRNIPLEADYGLADWLAEEGPFPESGATFDRKTLSAYKLGRIIKVSEELLQDAFFDIPAYVGRAFQRSFGDAEEAAFVVGDGVAKPRGVALDSVKGVDAAATNAVTGDELIDLFYSVKPGYRQNGSWLLSDALVKIIRKLKDGQGQYLWQPGLTGGQPDTLLTKKVFFSDSVAVPAATKKVAFFGDFSYYYIADRAGIAMQRLNELFAANGQVGFRMFKRTDGKLLVGEAVKHILTHA
jgi:HK97 family phage major capsid protein